MYSDMSKRINSIPRVWANCLVTSVFPTPVGPENRQDTIGLSVFPMPALAIFIEFASAEIAWSWPNTTIFRSRSRVLRAFRSEAETCLGGILAISATMFSISFTPMVFLRDVTLLNRVLAPASSMTSIAVSGRYRSERYLADNSTAERSAGLVYFTLWCFSNRVFNPRRISTASSTVGSSISIFWNLRDSARSFSKIPRYSR